MEGKKRDDWKALALQGRSVNEPHPDGRLLL